MADPAASAAVVNVGVVSSNVLNWKKPTVFDVCNSYEVEFDVGVHVNVADVPVAKDAPFAGDTNTGAYGAFTTSNATVLENRPLPPELFPRTLQK